MTRPRAGDLEGVDLAAFEVGVVYDLPPPLATYLVVTMSAELVDAADATPSNRTERRGFSGYWIRGVAADHRRDDGECRIPTASI